MSRYKAYPEYRDSGVAWLGKIPLSWSAVSIKRQALIFNGATPKSEVTDFWDGDISWITPADLGRDKSPYIMSGARSITQAGYSSCGTTLVPRGSVILSSRAPIGTLGIAAQELCTNQGCKSLVTGERLDSEYLFYVLLSSTTQLNLLGRGTTFLELSADELGLYKISFPPPADQRTIAAFLDHETAKIDALIEKQQRLIELLKEKRQAVISHAVTKGLNPNAPMKDSGVEWLGEVPAHWNTQKLAWRFTAKKGSNAAQLTKEFCASIEGEHPVYSGQTENSGVMACIDSYEFDAGEEGYLFSTTVGAKAMTVMHITGRFSLSQNCMVIIPCTAYSIPRFYYYHFQPLFSYERGLIPEHMQASFRMEDLYQYKVLEPPKSEQIEIANFLDVNTAVFDDLISRSLNACLLLQERRTALISAAVTGKIDVRDWQAAA